MPESRARYETHKDLSCRDPFGSMKEPPAVAEEGEDIGCHESITTKPQSRGTEVG